VIIQEKVREICEEIRSGLQLQYVAYSGCWRVPRSFDGTMEVFVSGEGGSPLWTLCGLWPDECELLCRALDAFDLEYQPLYPRMRQEDCVVATLATILHNDGRLLTERMAMFLRGDPVLYGRRTFEQPLHCRVSLRDAVHHNGWDDVARWLATFADDALFRGRVLFRGPEGIPDLITRTEAARIGRHHKGHITKMCRSIPGLAVGPLVSTANYFRQLVSRPLRDKAPRRGTTRRSHRDHDSDGGSDSERREALHAAVQTFVRTQGKATLDEIVAHVQDINPEIPAKEVRRILKNNDCFQQKVEAGTQFFTTRR